MELVERHAELAALSDCLEETRTGTGTLVLVGGEAGAGKSALVSRFLGEVAVPVVAGFCDGVATPRPLGPVIEIAAQLEVDTSLPRDDLFAAVLAALRQRGRGGARRGRALGRRRDRGVPALPRPASGPGPGGADRDLPQRRDRREFGVDPAHRRRGAADGRAADPGPPAHPPRRRGHARRLRARPGRRAEPDRRQRLLRHRGAGRR